MDETPSSEPPFGEAASPRTGRSREHWLVVGAAGMTLLGLVVLGMLLSPDDRGFGTHQQLGLQPCFPMEHWNVPCPGCGVTTSVSLAMHGNVWRSIVNQPFGFLVALLFAAFIVWTPVVHFRGRDLWDELQALPYGFLLKAVATIATIAWLYKLALVRGWLGG